MPASPAVFVAKDSKQCERLLRTVGNALDQPSSVAFVAGRADEGEETSVYLWSFYDYGRDLGHQFGYRRGAETAFDHVYGKSVADLAQRTKAREARKRAKASRRRNRKAAK